MAQYCHASHEVYHEGVAQRAHNQSLTCAFRRCQGDERKFLPLLRHRFAETRRLPPKGRASPRRQGLRVTGGPSFSRERGLAGRLISAYSRSFPPDNPLLLWV